MIAREFLTAVVLPNIEALKRNRSDLRQAYNAIHSVDALAAHIYWEGGADAFGLGDDDTHYRRNLAAGSDVFKLLRDAAKAAKHVRLVRGIRTISSSQQVSARVLGYGRPPYGQGVFGGSTRIVITTDTGEQRLVEAVVGGALAVLEAEMKRLGL